MNYIMATGRVVCYYARFYGLPRYFSRALGRTPVILRGREGLIAIGIAIAIGIVSRPVFDSDPDSDTDSDTDSD